MEYSMSPHLATGPFPRSPSGVSGAHQLLFCLKFLFGDNTLFFEAGGFLWFMPSSGSSSGRSVPAHC